jgi:hypothetical protein
VEFNEDQWKFCLRVRQGPLEVELRSLVDLLVPIEPGLGILQRLAQLDRALELLGFQVLPAVSDGDLDAARLVSVKAVESTVGNVLREIARDEDRHTELKSSFSCCLDTYRKKPDLAPGHFKKLAVEDSCLSAMAGMMNAGGGVILIGVEDDKSVVGLAPDLLAMGVKNTDKWLLYVRSKIERWFMDGRSINPLIDFSFVDLDGKTIARAAVQPRPKLAFLFDQERDKFPPRIMVRENNRTTEVKPEGLEEFFDRRAHTRRSR